MLVLNLMDMDNSSVSNSLLNHASQPAEEKHESCKLSMDSQVDAWLRFSVTKHV